MEKKLYYSLDNGEGEGGVMDLSSCMAWIDGDMKANYANSINMPPEDQPNYTLTPIWYTDAEYEALPDQ